jgi:PAS domain S-box-containing protein
MQCQIISNQELQTKIVETQDITEWQERENCLRKQNQALMQLAKSKIFQQSDLHTAVKEITEEAAKALDVERVSVWLYDLEYTKLECIDLYVRSTKHHSFGGILEKSNYPAYFQALEEECIIASHNPSNDKRTQELSEFYLTVLNIKSILNLPILLRDNLVGVLCHEHLGTERKWTLEEENFAVFMADFVKLAIEATERNIKHEVLAQREERFRAIFEHSSMGIVIVDIAGRIVDTNPLLEQILGYSQEELYGKNLMDYLNDQEKKLDFGQKLVSEIFSQKTDSAESNATSQYQKSVTKYTLKTEKVFLHKNCQVVWTYLNISLMKNKNGEAEFFLVMIEDISERKKTELKLNNSKKEAETGNQAKSEFLATMSHELRTPLNTIMGLAQLLLEENVGNLNNKQKEYVSYIYANGEELLTLINDILDLSQMEADKEQLLLLPLHVQQLCDAVIATVRDRALEKGLALTTEIDKSVDILIGDERRVKQMLLNLLTNAIKFTSAGKVSLEVKKVFEGILFTIADTGIGIDPSKFKFLFQPFKQLDSQLNRQYEGTGLGLALTRKLARLHGGDVTVESALGEGSRFILFLPNQLPQGELRTREKGETLEVNSSSSLALTSTAKRILLIENEEHTGKLLQDYLHIIGYHVERKKDSKDLLRWVQSRQPDLIFLNIGFLENLLGENWLNNLRQQPDLEDVPVVIMMPINTVREQKNIINQQEAQVKQSGVIEYINKPIGIIQLESILVKYLH